MAKDEINFCAKLSPDYFCRIGAHLAKERQTKREWLEERIDQATKTRASKDKK